MNAIKQKKKKSLKDSSKSCKKINNFFTPTNHVNQEPIDVEENVNVNEDQVNGEQENDCNNNIEASQASIIQRKIHGK